jgi:hypothetical protein
MLGSALEWWTCKVSGATYVIVGCGFVGCAEAEKSLEGGHRLASAVVPKHKLVQVDLELGATNPMVGAHEPLLEITDGAIGKGHHGLRSSAQFSSQRLGARDMLETDFVQTCEGFEAIGEDRGPRGNVPGKEVVERSRLEVGDHIHADAPRGSAALLHRHQDECGSAPFKLPAASDAGLGTTHPRVVDLDFTPKGFASEVYGRSSELVEDHPGGFVTAKPKLTLEEQGRNAPLIGRHQVGGPEPKRQGSLRIMKDGSRSQRDLVAASGTLPASPTHQSVTVSVGAAGALEALGPTAGGQVLLAGLLAGKLKLKLAERLGKGWSRHNPTLLLVVC